jgi:CRISPR-associated endonuclease/helicase Cas3
MIAAEWALKHRIQPNIKRKVLIVLPYLSIIDQTVKEYRRLFKHYGADELILEAHSIAERKYVDDSNENQSNKTNDSIDFLTDTWANDFIITTFDQFLYTLLSSKNSHLLRFHNLADALIIIDEIQALPSTLWAPFSLALNTLSKNINSKILIMSATQPNFLQTKELVPSPEKIFKNQNRYKILLKKTNQLTLKEFIDGCIKRIDEENWHQKRVLIVLNTRASARTILDFLENKINSDTFFLSADVTPKERLANIEKIKKNKPCLVIATQCIEAGVDIDMDFAIRDFAPLDSIVQCAGRCNRNGLKNRAEIEIISLINQKGKKYSDVVYDQTLLEKTAMVLNNKKVILEEDIFLVVTDYFKRIKDSKDTGTKNAEKWAYWDEKLNIKKLLRNDNDKYNFIVVSQDSPQTDEKPLRDSLLEALEIKDIWKKKRKIRSLQGRIAKLTISVWANGNILPEVIAEPMGCYYLLKDTYYIPGKGLNLKNLTGKSTCTFI